MKLIISFVSPIEEIEKTTEKLSFNIGRGQSADIVFLHHELSRLHFRIDYKDQQFFVTDLKSSNGTFINFKKIETEKMTPFLEGDCISFGGPKEYYFKIFKEKEMDVIEEEGLKNKPSPALVNEATGTEVSVAEESIVGGTPEFTLSKVTKNSKIVRLDLNQKSQLIKSPSSELSQKISKDLNSDVNDLRVEKNLLTNEIQSINDSKELLKIEHKNLLKEKEVLKNEVLSLQRVKSAIAQSHEELNKNIEGLVIEKKELNSRIESKKLKLNEMTEKKYQLKIEYDNLKNVFETLEKNIQDKKDELKKIERDLKVQQNINPPKMISETMQEEVKTQIHRPEILSESQASGDLEVLKEVIFEKLDQLAQLEESIEEKIRLIDVIELELRSKQSEKKIS